VAGSGSLWFCSVAVPRPLCLFSLAVVVLFPCLLWQEPCFSFCLLYFRFGCLLWLEPVVLLFFVVYQVLLVLSSALIIV
jgi:hypothetical protein